MIVHTANEAVMSNACILKLKLKLKLASVSSTVT